MAEIQNDFIFKSKTPNGYDKYILSVNNNQIIIEDILMEETFIQISLKEWNEISDFVNSKIQIK